MTDIEINELVARKLGWVKTNEPPIGSPLFGDKDYGWVDTRRSPGLLQLPDYCHSIAAALEIIEFVRDKHFYLERGVLGEKWMASLKWAEGDCTDYVVVEYADTAPMAICLAFLEVK